MTNIVLRWAPHPYLPHEEGVINERVVCRLGRTMSQERDRQFVVYKVGFDQVALAYGSTAEDAKAALVAKLARATKQ